MENIQLQKMKENYVYQVKKNYRICFNENSQIEMTEWSNLMRKKALLIGKLKFIFSFLQVLSHRLEAFHQILRQNAQGSD